MRTLWTLRALEKVREAELSARELTELPRDFWPAVEASLRARARLGAERVEYRLLKLVVRSIRLVRLEKIFPDVYLGRVAHERVLPEEAMKVIHD